MTKGSQLLVSGKPPYTSGRYFLELNARDKFGDLGITRIPYVIGKTSFIFNYLFYFENSMQIFNFVTYCTFLPFSLQIY